MMKKCFCFFFMVFFLLSSILPVFVKAQGTGNNDSGADVLWDIYYESYEQMLDDSELIIVGKVIDKTTILEGKTVLTKTKIRVLKNYKGDGGATIDIIQFGGVFKNHKTPFPRELAAFKANTLYCFFLKNANGGAFRIAGAGQGIFEVNHFDNILDACRNAFMEISSVYDTPTNGYEYSPITDSLTFYVDGSAYSSFTTSQLSSCCNGFYSWNNLSGITLYQASAYAYANIKVSIESITYNPGVCGHTDYSPRVIYIYPSCFDSSNLTNWQKIAAHEMGHAIGLAHNPWTYSVMTSGLNYQALYPQDVDINTLRVLYGTPW